MARFRGWTAKDIKKLTTQPKQKKIKCSNPYLDEITEALTKAKIPWSEEYRFHKVRRWRFDLVIGNSPEEILKYKIGIEFNGQVFTHGRHTRGLGYAKDMDKLNHAQIEGFRVLQYTSAHLKIQKERPGIGVEEVVNQVKELMKCYSE